ADADAAVVMKLGRNLPKVRRALARAGRLDRAIYVERGTMADAMAMRLAAKADDEAPYFAVVLVPGFRSRALADVSPSSASARATPAGSPRRRRRRLRLPPRFTAMVPIWIVFRCGPARRATPPTIARRARARSPPCAMRPRARTSRSSPAAI